MAQVQRRHDMEKKGSTILACPLYLRRMNWRPQQPMNILELRCHRLRQPLLLPKSDAYYGCFSWLHLPAQPPPSEVAADPALPDDVFEAKQAGLRHALAAIDAKAVAGVQP